MELDEKVVETNSFQLVGGKWNASYFAPTRFDSVASAAKTINPRDPETKAEGTVDRQKQGQQARWPHLTMPRLCKVAHANIA